MEAKRYKLRYCLSERAIEIEWEKEFKINKVKREITRYIERYKLTENEERIIKLLCDGKAHFEEELAKEVYGKSAKKRVSRIGTNVYELNKKIKTSTLNKDVEEGKEKEKNRAIIIERVSYSRYKIAREIEIVN